MGSLVSESVRVGVIGVGGMGRRHVENLHERVPAASVTAVMDADPNRSSEVAAGAGAVAFTEPEELIESPTVEAVVIASPDDTHAELVLACLAANKPVLCEKPLATRIGDARSIVAAEHSAGRPLVQVGFMRHFDPRHVAVKDAITAGDIGRPLFFRGWHRNPAAPPWPSAGEVVLSSAVHDLYSARWMLDSEIAEVAVLGSPIDPDRSQEPELQVFSMRMRNGALAVVEVNRDSGYGYEVGVEVVGSEGTVTIASPDAPTVRRSAGLRQRMDRDWLQRFADAYVLEAQAWVGGVLSGQVAGPTSWDGYATLAAAEAGIAAIDGGPQAVEIDDPR